MAINNPTITNYKPLYIQKGTNCYDTRTQWGLISKTNPYPMLPNPKDVYSIDWKDENGEDEFVTTIKYQPIEFSVQFFIRAKKVNNDNPAADIRTNMAAFFNIIKDGEFSLYDSYTAIGRQKVRYAGYEEDSFEVNGDYARCIFTIKFKANDPTTFVTYNSNTGKLEAIQ